MARSIFLIITQVCIAVLAPYIQDTRPATTCPTVYIAFHNNGAGGGIRTPEGIKPTDLQSVAFDRFATPAYLLVEPKPRIELGTSSLPWKRSTTELFGRLFTRSKQSLVYHFKGFISMLKL